MARTGLARRAALSAVALASILPVASEARAERPPTRGPTLVVLIVVDQLAAHTLQRWGGALDGGIADLKRRGAYYVHGLFAYAGTETCPGHATISTGSWPSVHGIVSNRWFEPSGQRVYCLHDPDHGRSPARMLSPGLGDALKLASPDSKVVALSGKDRSSIIFAGGRPSLVAWYDPEAGRLVPGRWHGVEPPGWFSEMAAEHTAAAAFGASWDRFREDVDYEDWAGPDDLPSEAKVPGVGRTFPRKLGQGMSGPNAVWSQAYRATPRAVDALFQLAERAIVEERLGRRGVVDLLTIGVSALDIAGHWWGVGSQEAFDLLLRTDAAIARLERKTRHHVGRGRTLFVLTGDHGAAFPPERVRARGASAQRISVAELEALAAKALSSVPRGPDAPKLLSIDPPRIFMDLTGVRPAQRTKVRRAVAESLAKHPAILEAYAVEDVDRFAEPNRSYYRRSLFPGRSADVLIRHRPFDVVDRVGEDGLGQGSSHGSPYLYDMSVPIVVAGPGVSRTVVHAPVHMTRIAPTIAALAGFAPPPSAHDAPLDAVR